MSEKKYTLEDIQKAFIAGTYAQFTNPKLVVDKAAREYTDACYPKASSGEKGDKKFSLKDMEECFNKSRQVQVGFNDYINSLTPKEHSEGEGREVEFTEWIRKGGFDFHKPTGKYFHERFNNLMSEHHNKWYSIHDLFQIFLNQTKK